MGLTRRQGIAAGVLCAVVIAAGTAAYIVLRDRDDAQQQQQQQQQQPVVQVQQGALRGQWMDLPAAANGGRFAAFRGIPYARPPLGALRFKAPRPPTPWEGVWDAGDDRADCLQVNAGQAEGSEDCLYLDVYTPRLPDEQAQEPLPVYFFIHGGTFIFGSGNYSRFGPDFLMLQNIVVVTIKYRVNVFGFLNLDNEDVPGNAGIKDQIAALKWVHRNIAQFGGDPETITVGGQSAGAVTAQWLSLLPESRDLVQRVILESGSALHSFGYNEDNFEVALALGRRMTGANVTLADVSKLVMESSAEELMSASYAMMAERLAAMSTQIPYAVSPEKRAALENGEKPLITGSPETYIIDPLTVQKPMLVGMNSREWLLSFANHADTMLFRIATLINLLPKNIIPYTDTISYLNLTEKAGSFTWEGVVDAVDKYFFHRNDTDCDLTCTFKKYLDDIIIGVDTNRLVELRARSNSTTFVYRFAVRDAYNLSPLVEPEQDPDGAVHNDELGYLWKRSDLTQKLEGDGLATLTLKRMTNMWGSFVRSGIPTPNEELDGIWEPTEKRTRKIIFLNIGKYLAVTENDIAGSNMPFWFELYEKYRDHKST